MGVQMFSACKMCLAYQKKVASWPVVIAWLVCAAAKAAAEERSIEERVLRAAEEEREKKEAAQRAKRREEEKKRQEAEAKQRREIEAKVGCRSPDCSTFLYQCVRVFH